MIDYSKVLQFKYPGTSWTINETYESLIWLDLTPKPTYDELVKANEEYLDFKQKTAYKDLRVLEYPPISDQLDLIFHQGLDAWKASIQLIKDKYPKPL